MANIILFDNEIREQLLPLTYTRPVCELRVGILTIREKWEKWLNAKAFYITQDYLAGKYSIEYDKENYLINGSVLPSDQLCRLLKQMDDGEAFLAGEELIAAKLDEEQMEQLMHDEDFGELKGFDLQETEFLRINHLCDLYRLNDQAMRQDFALLTAGRTSQPISPTNRWTGEDQIFIEEGAKVEFSTLNANTGPIYIGKDAEIMEGCNIRGGLALCEGATLKIGAKIYGATTIGPYSKVGGEVNNSIVQGYSNKAHDGFLGNSFIGEWCNIGADTNTSNLKNTYDEVKLWNYPAGRFLPTGQQFCGLFMGDHSLCGINTMFNTGTVIGVGANVFGAGFPRNFIPSFVWGGPAGYQTYRTDKAFQSIERMMARRNKDFDIQERLILLRVFEDSAKYRTWEK
ncbi:MAG: GlmU family protein [Saprospiraceae bacterium]|nr:GlmU family protein [Saprospiraceae bacterium]